MPITREDVLCTLRHPMVGLIDFWVEGLHIHGAGYSRVADALEAKVRVPGSASYRRRIEFVSGTSSGDDGTYYSDTNKLVVSRHLRLDLWGQAIIVHECTHAYVDLSGATATSYFSDEVAAYIAEALFLMLFSPSLKPRRDGSRFQRMFHAVGDLVLQFRLYRPEGRGTHLRFADYSHLRGLVHRVDGYRDAGLSDPTDADGI